jgi:uncharacterized membrane protein
MHYFPIGAPIFALLALGLVVLLVLIPLKVLHQVYLNLGVSPGAAVLLLAGSLIGSYFNIPIAQIAAPHYVSAREVNIFGEIYDAPMVVDWQGVIIAINVGGALIPILMSAYLLFKMGFWARAAVATAVVAALCHHLATPVQGIGVAIPAFAPGVAAALVSLALAPRLAAPVAYVSGSLGVLIGADLMNLDKIQAMGAPIASIGGAGTFDSVFLTGVVAVLIASLSPFGRKPAAPRRAA